MIPGSAEDSSGPSMGTSSPAGHRAQGLGTGVRAAGPESKAKSAPPFLRKKDKLATITALRSKKPHIGSRHTNWRFVYYGGKPIAHLLYGNYEHRTSQSAASTKRKLTMQIR